ncbi:MAG: hypothetical protein NWF07_06010 [Candidatus Bathyarchaeota archaeon]|nr:hypothetical protein [Candidatus Bathyarchaeota archaeon]
MIQDYKTKVNTAVKILELSIILTALYSIDFYGIRLQLVSSQIPYVFIMSLMTTLAVYYTLSLVQSKKLRLVAAMFIALYSLRTLLTQVETLVFVPELVNIIPKILFNDFIVLFIYSFIAVEIFRKKNTDLGSQNNILTDKSRRTLILKIFLISIIYVVIYILFGLFVFRPIANFLDPVALIHYVDVETPSWILQFQLLRGASFIILSLPIIRQLEASWKESAFAIGFLFSLVMGGNLIIPNTGIPDMMRIAHLIEVVSENLIFGFISIWILQR